MSLTDERQSLQAGVSHDADPPAEAKPNRSSVAYVAKALAVGEPGTHVDDLSGRGIQASLALRNGLQVANYNLATVDGSWKVVQFLDSEQRLGAVSLYRVFDGSRRGSSSNAGFDTAHRSCSPLEFERHVSNLVAKFGQPKVITPVEGQSLERDFASTHESTIIRTQSRQWPLDDDALLVMSLHLRDTDVYRKRSSGDKLRSEYRTCTLTICVFPDAGRDLCLAPAGTPYTAPTS
jgi:hypothetical protein